MDPLTASLMGGSLASSIAGAFASKSSNDANIGFQRQVNNENASMMREAWGREDTAVQRRVNDLRSAGMSPVLAAGQGAASGAAIKVDAPSDNGWAQQSVQNGIQNVLAASQLRQTAAQVALTKSQERKTDTETNIGIMKAPAELNAIDASAKAARASAGLSSENARTAKVDADKAGSTGITPSSSAFGKMANDAAAGIKSLQEQAVQIHDKIKSRGYIEAYKDAYRPKEGK